MQLGNTAVPFDDANLLDEVDEILRQRLFDAERSGIDQIQLQLLAKRYGRMYDLVDSSLTKRGIPPATTTFKNETFSLVVEGFFDKIHNIYDLQPGANDDCGNDYAKEVVAQVRYKQRRLRRALFRD